MPLTQGSHMDPMRLQYEVGQILTSGTTEIGALGTPGLSHGTKFFVPRNFSYYAKEMLFYVFFWYVLQKRPKFRETWFFNFPLNKKMSQNH